MSTLFFPFQFINMLGSFYMCTNAGKEWGNFRVYKKEAKTEIQFSNLYLTFFILLSEIQDSKLRLNFIFVCFLHLRYLNKLSIPSVFPISRNSWRILLPYLFVRKFFCFSFVYLQTKSSKFLLSKFLPILHIFLQNAEFLL